MLMDLLRGQVEFVPNGIAVLVPASPTADDIMVMKVLKKKKESKT